MSSLHREQGLRQRGLRQHPPRPWWKRKSAQKVAGAIASILIALVTAYVLWFAGPSSQSPPPGTNTPALRARIKLISALGNAVIPKPISHISRPPAYPASLAGNHCGTWQSWFVRQHAAQAMYPYLVQISAPAKADVTVVRAQISVYKSYMPADLSYIECLHGAGPVPGTFVNVNLSRPNAIPTIVADNGTSKPLSMPGAVINVSPGHTEYLQFITRGRNLFYDWSIRLQVVVDEHTETFSFGSAAHPLRTWLGKAPAHSYDYNQAVHTWESGN